MTTKYNIDDVVLCNAFDINARDADYKSIQSCKISMITITRKGIRYRVKIDNNNGQDNFWEDEILGRKKESK